MVALIAEFGPGPAIEDSRILRRRTLRLHVPASTADGASEALVRNLSERGLLVETEASFRLGDVFNVELPELGNVAARVVWKRGRSFGCRFEQAVSKAVVSAALLRSPAKLPDLQIGQIIPPLHWNPEAGWEQHGGEAEMVAEPVGFAVTALIVAASAVALFLWALLSLPLSPV